MRQRTPLNTEIRRRVQRALRTRSFRDALRSNSGAIDLASIMVGVIVIGVIAGVIAATVFAVIPWSQDAAAKQGLDAVRTAESVTRVQDNRYTDMAGLVAASRIQTSTSVSVGTDADGTCYVGVSKSATGKVFYVTDTGPDVKELTAAAVVTCTIVGGIDLLVTSVGGPMPAAAPLPNQFATFTNTTVTAGQTTRAWNDTASSADGTKLVASVESYGHLYTSTDSGVTWVEHANQHPEAWAWGHVASSADGVKLLAVGHPNGDANTGYLYTSADSGVTWVEHTAAGSTNWTDVASSADGTKLVATENRGYIYTSSDSGSTWVKQYNSTDGYWGRTWRDWASIASSADGTKLIASDQSLYRISLSTDSGATWTELSAPGIAEYNSGVKDMLVKRWGSVSSSADGSKLAAVAYDGGQPCTSVDSGATWKCNSNAYTSSWTGIVSSADGTKLVAGSSNNGFYTSTDAGVTWTQRNPSTVSWTGFGMSADGSKVYGGGYNERRYSFVYGP